MHVYHYAPYEPSTMKRLMGMHGTREQEVDELLRGERFVDLYAVVRQGVRIGTESYSLKQVEKLYHAAPRGRGDGRRREHRRLRASGSTSRTPPCSTRSQPTTTTTAAPRSACATGSKRRRADAEALYGQIPRPVPGSGEASEELTAREEELDELAERLADVPDEPEHRRRAHWLLAQLLHWHRREEKPEWWTYFARIDYTADDDFVDDRECIGGLEPAKKVRDEVDSRPCTATGSSRRTTSSRSGRADRSCDRQEGRRGRRARRRPRDHRPEAQRSDSTTAPIPAR